MSWLAVWFAAPVIGGNIVFQQQLVDRRGRGSEARITALFSLNQDMIHGPRVMVQGDAAPSRPRRRNVLVSPTVSRYCCGSSGKGCILPGERHDKQLSPSPLMPRKVDTGWHAPARVRCI